jgi:hypothetical protein
MKSIKSLYFIVYLSAIICCFSSCKEDSDQCKETAWESTINYSVQPKLKAAASHLPDDRNLKEAVELQFLGVVRKFHCGGELSGGFWYASKHDPRAIDNSFWTDGFYVGKVYGFDFNNDEDYLEYDFYIIATFADSVKYKMDTKHDNKAYPPFAIDWDRSFFYANVSADDQWDLFVKE